MKKTVLALLTVVAAVALAACGSSSSSTKPASGSSNVTLTGAVQPASLASTASAPGTVLRPFATSVDLTQYHLYCVTFTDPPDAGTANLAADGSFTTTLQNAANVPIGCFINDASNAVVATVSFIIGGSSITGSNTSSQTTLPGGTYSITINFDPSTGIATADVTQWNQAAPATFQPSALAGVWSITCDPTQDSTRLASCLADLGNGTGTQPAMLNVLQGDFSGTTHYGASAWFSQQAFINAGATEGLSQAALTAQGITNTQLYSPVTSPVPTLVGSFGGFTAEPAYSNLTNDQVTGSDVLAILQSEGIPFDGTLTYDHQGGNTNCSSMTSATIDLSTQMGRYCLIDYLRYLHEQWQSAYPTAGSAQTYASEVPVPDPNQRGTYITTGTDATTPIQFATDFADSPRIGARLQAMDMEISGNTATLRFDDSGTDAFPMGGSFGSCPYSHQSTIVFVMTDATHAAGHYTQNRYDACANMGSPSKVTLDYLVTMTKQ